MSLKFYNTLSKEKEDFSPIDKDEVRMYTCGPTVYNYPHIGNYRAYIFADTLKRVLLYSGYNVRHIMNLTDIDDKTIRESQKEGKTLKEFTEFYTGEFMKDVDALNILHPAKFTKATDYIDEMVAITQKLLEKGLAYSSPDGSVYFDIHKFKNYGKLSNLVLEEQKENASGRIKKDEYEKENAEDFALWKAWDSEDGDVFWDTPLGRGRPGWHIECSAMSMKNLGEQLDIHTGGVDNIFPHHENEIAQSEGVTGKQFVKYWMHNEFLDISPLGIFNNTHVCTSCGNKNLVKDASGYIQKIEHDGVLLMVKCSNCQKEFSGMIKMSKSKGNLLKLNDIIKKGINPLAYRFELLMASYRTKLNFSWEALSAAETALKRLYRAYKDLGEDLGSISTNYQSRFKTFIEDDLDTPQAISLMWELLKDEDISKEDKKATLLDFDKIFGLGLENLKDEPIPEEVQSLAREREDARKDKDFKLSDELREKINSLGYEVKDTEDGQQISKI